ncbi:MAG: hypothetical protein PHX80_03890 [Candidatus Nanoarchaeia archaeon]|nr:hypothetical protein [Candidatus Nanoarchaeia archaeon]
MDVPGMPSNDLVDKAMAGYKAMAQLGSDANTSEKLSQQTEKNKHVRIQNIAIQIAISYLSSKPERETIELFAEDILANSEKIYPIILKYLYSDLESPH